MTVQLKKVIVFMLLNLAQGGAWLVLHHYAITSITTGPTFATEGIVLGGFIITAVVLGSTFTINESPK